MTNLPLVLGASSGEVLHWYMDAAFVIHPNMRGHSGGALTLGLGFPISSSGKQKLYTCSSTENKLVGIDYLMSLIIWSCNFLKKQGYDVVDIILHQDNRSAILLEQNGKMSSGKRTKHIAICYFFVTDRNMLGTERPSPTKPNPGTCLLPVTRKLDSPKKSLTWADQTRIPIATE
jgi:hypothetical protein